MPTQFFRDPYALFKYNAVALLVYIALIAGLVGFGLRPIPPSAIIWIPLAILIAQSFFGLSLVGMFLFVGYFLHKQPVQFGMWQAAQMGMGVAVGMISATSMHNAVHGNFRPRWLNNVIGELTGLMQLLGYEEWKIAHIIHHQHPDDPAYDPHPPLALPFWKFTLMMNFKIATRFTIYYYEQWGKNPRSQRIWAPTGLLILTNLFARGILMVILLGIPSFVFFFIPNFLTIVLFYAHFNYFTHRSGQEERTYEILNLNETWVYKFLNAVSWGSYFHKNHHLNPRLFNPRYATVSKVSQLGQISLQLKKAI